MTMSKQAMSDEARIYRNYYYKVERWENKAKRLYGDKYVPAKKGEVISAQALQLRKDYEREYRKKHRAMFAKAEVTYWEKKAKEHMKNLSDKKGVKLT